MNEKETAKFDMNDLLKDNISGFNGRVQGITFYSTGCISYGLAATTLKPDGTIMDFQWLDESRLCLVKAAKLEQIGIVDGKEIRK